MYALFNYIFVFVDYISRLNKHRAYLQSTIKCIKSGLLDELLSRGVLSSAKVHKIKSFKHNETQSRHLVKMMSSVTNYNQHEEFLVSLWTTNQSHLASYIINDGPGENDLQLFFY